MKISIEKQVTYLLQQMEHAMPEVKRQVEVYKKSLKDGRKAKISSTTISIKHG